MFVGQAYFRNGSDLLESQIVFNRSLKNDVNMRGSETLASGSLLLTNDIADNGQADLFRDSVHLATYCGAGLARQRVLPQARDMGPSRRWICGGDRESHVPASDADDFETIQERPAGCDSARRAEPERDHSGTPCGG